MAGVHTSRMHAACTWDLQMSRVREVWPLRRFILFAFYLTFLYSKNWAEHAARVKLERAHCGFKSV